MKVLHVSTYDGQGGAGRAAYALHRALLGVDVDSRMLVASSSSGDHTVTELAGSANTRWRAAQQADRRVWDLQKSPNTAWRSPAAFGALSADMINRSSADVVNLHWVTNGFLSINQIGRITKPIVWSMYDMWTFSGTEHYGADTADARWRQGYTRDNRLAGESGVDIDRWAWERKTKHWTASMHMIPASTWLEDRVEASALRRAKPWKVTRIPHVIDTQVFTPMDQAQARAEFDLPADTPLVLFLASGGVHDQRKGWDLLDQALVALRADAPDVEVVIAGPVPERLQGLSGVPVHLVGEIRGSERLRALYASASVVAVPSREDTMPLTAMEAQACGVPVVAFGIGGLPDIVEHEATGYLARAFDPADLAAGLAHVLGAAPETMATKARARAVNAWSPTVVAGSYLDVYQAALAARRK
jgi:glycosyltransferase involved in cell wall biosynthesis